MTQVPMRMQQPGLVPPHQQRPPMMVSMTQPPPVTMQGLVTMAPMMSHGGGMAVMTQALSHPDSGHDHHHSMSAPYHHPHHHHHHHHHPHHHPPHHHGPRHPPPHSHHQGPPHHPAGPPPSHTGPPHTQYHPHHPPGPHHGQHGHGGLPNGPPHSLSHAAHHGHNVPHMNSHNSLPPSGPHGHAQGHISVQPPSHSMNQPQHNLPPPSNQATGRSRNVSPSQHQQLPPQPVVPVQQPAVLHQSQPPPTNHSTTPPTVETSNVSGPITILSSSTENISSTNATPSSPSSVTSIQNVSSSVTTVAILTIPAIGSTLSEISEDSDLLSTREKTPMCLINELARYNKIQHHYCLTEEKGPAHRKVFTVTLRLGDKEEEFTAAGRSIKKAQHSAAALALAATKFKQPPPKPPRPAQQVKLTPTVELNALAMKRGELAIYSFLDTPRPPPTYAYGLPPSLRGIYPKHYYRPPIYPPFFVSLKVGPRDFTGEGGTSQQAKHNAAAKALRILKALPVPEQETPSHGSDLLAIDANAELKSPISMVHEIALKRNLSVMFDVVDETGPPHMRTFETACVVGSHRTGGEGTGKKGSKKKAAESMLEELKKLPALPSASLAQMKRKSSPKKKGRSNLIKEQKSAPEYGQGINPISRLIQIQQAKKEKEPVYTLLAERGVPRRREFIMQVTVGGQTTQGNGPNKKLAKRAAAESMLQLMGYSKPSAQPVKPAIKMDTSNMEADKGRKQVTFVEENGHAVSEMSHVSSACPVIPAGSSGRQLVPGLIMMPENSAIRPYQSVQPPSVNGDNTNPMVPIQTTAAIAKELLDTGTSTTAKTLTKPSLPQQVPTPVQPSLGVPQMAHQPQKPATQSNQSTTSTSTSGTTKCNGLTISGNTTAQVARPKDQLMYLATILNLQVQFTDFPKGNKSEYLSLVSLSTTPPHVSHGAGTSIDASHDQACLTALRALAEMGLDSVTSANVDSNSV